MPAPMTADTTSPAASVDGNAASSVSTRCGRGTTRTTISVAIPSVPSEPTKTPARSRAPSRSSRTASPSARTTSELEDMGRREAVLQAVGAAGVLGDVAADRAHLLARGVGGVEQPVGGDRARHVEVRDARLDAHAPVGDVDIEDPVHARQADHDALGDRHRPAREPRPGPAGDERRAVVAARPHRRLDLLRGSRQDDRQRHGPVAHEPVALICPELRGLRDHGPGRRARAPGRRRGSRLEGIARPQRY